MPDYPTRPEPLSTGDPVGIGVDKWLVAAALAGAGAGSSASMSMAGHSAWPAVVVCVLVLGALVWLRRGDSYESATILLVGGFASVLPTVGLAATQDSVDANVLWPLAAEVPVAVLGLVLHLKARQRSARAPNPLRDRFDATTIAEIDGIQFVMLPPVTPLPRHENAYFVVWLHNAMSTPRSVALRLEESRALTTRAPQLALPEPESFDVLPGQVGRLVARLHVHAFADKPRANVHPTLVVTRTNEGPGSRVTPWRARPGNSEGLEWIRFWSSPATGGLLSNFSGTPYAIQDKAEEEGPKPDRPALVWLPEAARDATGDDA